MKTLSINRKKNYMQHLNDVSNQIQLLVFYVSDRCGLEARPLAGVSKHTRQTMCELVVCVSVSDFIFSRSKDTPSYIINTKTHMFSRLPPFPGGPHTHAHTHIWRAKHLVKTPGDPEEITDRLKMGQQEDEEEEEATTWRGRKTHLLLVLLQTADLSGSRGWTDRRRDNEEEDETEGELLGENERNCRAWIMDGRSSGTMFRH